MSNQKTEAEDNSKSYSKPVLEQKKEKTFAAFYGSKLFVKCFGWFILITLINTILVSVYGYFYYFKPAKEEYKRFAEKLLQNNGQQMVETYEKQGNLNLAKFRGPGNYWLYNENLEILFDGMQKNGFGSREFGHFNPNLPGRPEGFPPPPPPGQDIKSNEGPKHVLNTNSRPTIEAKPSKIQLFKIKYQNFYKNNIEKISHFAGDLLNEAGTKALKINDEFFYGCQLTSDNGKKYAAIIHIPKDGSEHRRFFFINQAKSVFPLIILVCAVLCFVMARHLAKPIIELQEASRKFARGDFSQKITKKSMDRYDEIGDLASDFNDMAERIESGINNQKRLFNDISHELRSPLARMQVGLELLQMKVKDSEKPLVERLEKDVNRMNALIGEVLQFSKLENKEMGAAKEEINLAKSLEDVCSDAEFEGNNNHKGVRLNIKKDAVIKGNVVLIERAFENIIRNGLRFTPENTLVEVSLDVIDNKAVIKIADHGPGIPESDINKIFEPFYCVKPDRNPQNGGIGLGLPIALRAIELHNGTIKMENRTEGGLLVTIELPLENN